MAWQKFQNTNQRFEDRISINPNNAFGFPTKFYKDNSLETFKFLVIFYNPETREIGFQFTNNEEEKHKFRITRSKGQYGTNVTATSFFKSYKLDTKSLKGKYMPEKRNVEGFGILYVIDLNKNLDVPKSNSPSTQVNPVAEETKPLLQTQPIVESPKIAAQEGSPSPVDGSSL